MRDQIILDFDKITLRRDTAAEKLLKHFCRTAKSLVLTTKKPSLITKWLIYYDLDSFVDEINLFDYAEGVYAVHFNCDELTSYYYEKKSAS